MKIFGSEVETLAKKFFSLAKFFLTESWNIETFTTKSKFIFKILETNKTMPHYKHLKQAILFYCELIITIRTRSCIQY